MIKLIKRRWNTIKWLIKEFIKVGSSEKSFFSKKRIFEIIAFSSGEITLLAFFFYNIARLSTMEATGIATLFFAVAGYTLTKTEAAKKTYLEGITSDNNLDETK